MAKKVTPNARCRLIGGTEGPKSPNVGIICLAIHLQPREHIVHGPLWYVEALGGDQFVTQGGGVGKYCTVAEDWLEVLDDDETSQQRIAEKAIAD